MYTFKFESNFGRLYDRRGKLIGQFSLDRVSKTKVNGWLFRVVEVQLIGSDMNLFWPEKYTLPSKYGNAFIIPSQGLLKSGLEQEIIYARDGIESERLQFVPNCQRIVHRHSESVYLSVWINDDIVCGFTLKDFDERPPLDARWKLKWGMKFFGTCQERQSIYPMAQLEEEVSARVSERTLSGIAALLAGDPKILEQVMKIITRQRESPNSVQ
jgi:hypothetical protein